MNADLEMLLNVTSAVLAVGGLCWGFYEFRCRKKRDERIEEKLHEVERKEDKIAKKVEKK